MTAATVVAFSSAPAQGLRQPRCVRVAAAERSAAAAGRRQRTAPVLCQEQQQQRQQQQQQQQQLPLTRRGLLSLPAGLAAVAALAALPAGPAAALLIPPPGFRYHEDKLDGYSFLYPEDWQPVTTSGNDIFFRNPFNVEENCFVDASSPSSSKYETVADLGTPQDAAKRITGQFLEEFMSTRLGVRRTAEVVDASQRTDPDGRLYYDIFTRVKSYASRNQLAVTQAEIEEGVILEWDRTYLTVLGVAGKRLYQLRLQGATSTYEKGDDRLLAIARSFRCKEVAQV